MSIRACYNLNSAWKCFVNKQYVNYKTSNLSLSTMGDSVQLQCQFFVLKKKRLCRMTVKPGRQYCGEHEPQPRTQAGEDDTRIPCPNDSKHTCYASKLQKHLLVCNARQKEIPPYIVHNVNYPAEAPSFRRAALKETSPELLTETTNTINDLYERHVKGNIKDVSDVPIHSAVLEDFNESGRTESSRRHLRQISALMHLMESEGLVVDGTTYIELGAGKGRLGYYVGRAWCSGQRGRLVVVDRAALRHKRDNKLECATRLRCDLAHLRLRRVPELRDAPLVALGKHLCGDATDLALRCAAEAECAGVAVSTCCHHRCAAAYCGGGGGALAALGVAAAQLAVAVALASWATCAAVPPAKERLARRARALLDWGRVLHLRQRGYRASLCRYVEPHVSPDNFCVFAVKGPPLN